MEQFYFKRNQLDKLLKVFLISILFYLPNFVLATPGGTGTNDNSNECFTALPFCSGESYDFPNTSVGSAPSGPNYGCLGSQPAPIWYLLQIEESGPMQLSLYQQNNAGTSGLDIDFAMWGPFDDLENGCAQIMSGNLPPLQCSYSASESETVGIGMTGGSGSGQSTPPNAQQGEIYILLLTNWSENDGFISLEQTGGTGSTDCSIVVPCQISDLTTNVTECVGGVYSVSGSFEVSDPPETGDLIAEDCNGNQVVIASAPFDEGTYNYELVDLDADGAQCSVKVYFSEEEACTKTQTYTAAECLCENPIINVQDLTSCTGSVSLNDAIVSNQNQGVITFYQTQSNANNAVSPIGSTVTSSGSYWVRAENPEDPDCFVVEEIVINISNITFTVNSVNPTCGEDNGSVQITANGGLIPYGYGMLIGGAPQESFTGLFEDLGEGEYTFVIVDANECQATGSVTLVDEGVILDASFEFDDFCEGNLNGPHNIVSQGGTFSFATEPTDGAIINPSTGTLINAVGGTTYTVVYTVGDICVSDHSVSVYVNQSPTPTFIATDTEGCKPLSVSFINTSGFPNATCLWDFGDGATSNACEGEVTHTYNASGLYDVSLTLTDENGCTETLIEHQLINVINGPTADFTADPMNATTEEPEVTFTNNSTDATIYTWDFGDESPNSSATSPKHTFPQDKFGTYVVTLIASNGVDECNDTMRVVITVDEDLLFFIPNSFTPDNDNFNEVFKPIFTSGYDPQSYTMVIYNRWGEPIFESHDTEFGWDGTYGADSNRIVPEGSYIWRIQIKEVGKDKYNEYSGTITLLR